MDCESGELSWKNFIWTVRVCLGEFATYLRHVRSLKFTDKPDYVYLRNLFHDVLCKHSWECDWEFDWVAQQKVCTWLNGLALYELLTHKLLPRDSTFLKLLLLFNGPLARCTWVIWFPLESSLCVGSGSTAPLIICLFRRFCLHRMFPHLSFFLNSVNKLISFGPPHPPIPLGFNGTGFMGQMSFLQPNN